MEKERIKATKRPQRAKRGKKSRKIGCYIKFIYNFAHWYHTNCKDNNHHLSAQKQPKTKITQAILKKNNESKDTPRRHKYTDSFAIGSANYKRSPMVVLK
jgi:hypothetical protein